MRDFKIRLNRVEDNLYPPGQPVVLTGSTKEEMEEKYRQYLKNGETPNSLFVFVVAEKIEREP